MISYNNDKFPVQDLIINGAKGLLIGAAVATILLFAFAGIAYSTDDPDSLTAPLGYAALFISAATAGGVSGKLSRENGGRSAIHGAVSGAMLMLATFLMTFLPSDPAVSSPSLITRILMYAAIPAVSALFGYLLRPRKKLRRRRRR